MEEIALRSAELARVLVGVTKRPERVKLTKEFIKDVLLLNIKGSDFPRGLEWFNSAEPLSLSGNLSGRLVLLDFFTYCCINCMHILPDLEAVEQAFPQEKGLQVVGVHSAKFDNEKVSANIRAALLRYGIHHPVVNDCDAILWHEMLVQCWPTVVLIGPDQKVLLSLAGEGHRDVLLDCIEVALEHYSNTINRQPIQPGPSANIGEHLFPSKICIDAKGERLVMSDAVRHRIVVASMNGMVQHVIGGRGHGLTDGSFISSQFFGPQGVCFHGDDLIIVADTENHAIRKIDLVAGTVRTIAGNGKQGTDLAGGKLFCLQEISSPWDVVMGSEGVVYIAMAGTHQIWALCLDQDAVILGTPFQKGTCVRIAGSGEEENRNTRYPLTAAFAQPSGLAIHKIKLSPVPENAPPLPPLPAGPAAMAPLPPFLPHGSDPPPHTTPPPPPPRLPCPQLPPPPPRREAPPPPLPPTGCQPSSHPPPICPPPPPLNPSCVPRPMRSGYTEILYIADSESSSIRSLDLSDGSVKSVVGADIDPKNLFAFGDVDGKGIEAKLQHPLAVTLAEDGQLFVADSYNHKIKKVVPKFREVRTVFGTGKMGDTLKDSPLQCALNEPGGLAYNPHSRRLYIADTNNHYIKIYDTEANMSGIMLFAFPPEKMYSEKMYLETVPPSLIRDPASAETKNVNFEISGPGAVVVVRVKFVRGEGIHFTPEASSQWQLNSTVGTTVTPECGDLSDDSSEYSFQVQPDNNATVELHHLLYYCSSEGVCKMKSLIMRVKFSQSSAAITEAENVIDYQLT